MSATQKPELSIISTVYNDAPIVPSLVSEIKAAVAPLGVSYEIILVHDHGPDNSEDVIREIAKKDPIVKAISLARNYGQQIAMSAGLDYAQGEFAVIMDGDLQNPPEAIPQIYKILKSGQAEVVFTVSETRNTWLDELTSTVFWFLVCRVLGVNIVKNQLMLKGFSANVLAAFRRYGERTRLISGIVHDIGFSFKILSVQNRRRAKGRSNYSFLGRCELLIDMVITLSTRGLDLLMYAGVLGSLFAMAVGSYYLFVYFYLGAQPGFTSIVLSVFFFGSANMFALGLIGRYLANIYKEVRARPLYLVEKKYNL